MKFLLCSFLVSVSTFLCVAPVKIPSEFLSKKEIDRTGEICKINFTSVLVNNCGTGTIFVKDKQAYILTCCHVLPEKFKGLVSIIEIIKDEEYLEIYRKTYKARIIAYSETEDKEGKDLAVLKLIYQNTHKGGAVFYKNKLKILDKVLHIGNLNGVNPDSIVLGTICNYIRRENLNDELFYTINLEARCGSSGGPVYIKTDKYYYCGMITRADKSGISLMKPLSVIKEWLKSENLLSKFSQGK